MVENRLNKFLACATYGQYRMMISDVKFILNACQISKYTALKTINTYTNTFVDFIVFKNVQYKVEW